MFIGKAQLFVSSKAMIVFKDFDDLFISLIMSSTVCFEGKCHFGEVGE